MSIVGRCPQCGESSVLFSYTYPDTAETRFICDECAYENNREWLNENTCPCCGELFDECTCKPDSLALRNGGSYGSV